MKYQQLENLEAGWKWFYLVKKYKEGKQVTRYIDNSEIDVAVQSLLAIENSPMQVSEWIERHMAPDLEIKLKQAIRAKRKRYYNAEQEHTKKKSIDLDFPVWKKLSFQAKELESTLSDTIEFLLSETATETNANGGLSVDALEELTKEAKKRGASLSETLYLLINEKKVAKEWQSQSQSLSSDTLPSESLKKLTKKADELALSLADTIDYLIAEIPRLKELWQKSRQTQSELSASLPPFVQRKLTNKSKEGEASLVDSIDYLIAAVPRLEMLWRQAEQAKAILMTQRLPSALMQKLSEKAKERDSSLAETVEYLLEEIPRLETRWQKSEQAKIALMNQSLPADVIEKLNDKANQRNASITQTIDYLLEEIPRLEIRLQQSEKAKLTLMNQSLSFQVMQKLQEKAKETNVSVSDTVANLLSEVPRLTALWQNAEQANAELLNKGLEPAILQKLTEKAQERKESLSDTINYLMQQENRSKLSIEQFNALKQDLSDLLDP